MKRKMFPQNFAIGWLGLVFGFVLSLSLFPGVALAERSLTMDQLVVDAQVLPDASMRVTERITVDFSGQWNGFYIKIPQGATPIREVTVNENGQPYQFNPGTEYGPPGTYLTRTEGNQILIDWSIVAADEVRTFDVTYRVINAVKIHSDTAELYRKFVGEANSNKIAKVQVNLKLPAGAEQYKQGEEIRIWGHGPLTGEVNFAGPDTIVWAVNNLPANTFLEGRVVMPSALFSTAPAEAYTKQPALAAILAEEASWADNANRQRTMAKAEYAGGAGIIGGALVGIILLWRRFGRSHKVAFQGDYYRDLPALYSPAELSVLWNFKAIQARDITATILDLARRKFLYLEEATVEVPKLLGSKEVSTYRLKFLSAPAPEAFRKPEEAVVQTHEQQLLDLLRKDIGKGQEQIFLTDIEKYAKDNGEKFYKFWKEWTSGLVSQGEKLKFFEDKGKMPLFTILGGLGLIILGSILVAKTGVIGFALIITGVLFLIIPSLFKRRSVSGQEDYVRWRAFKKFLEHFSEMERHEIPSLIIWEHYLVFAVTLGVAKEVIKQLELVFPNMQDGDYHFGYGWMTYGTYRGMNTLNDSFENIGNSFQQALQTAEKAVSKASSGSGGGGGFSGGGGGGGGGSSFGGR
jgi:uncharacterized membrane protein